MGEKISEKPQNTKMAKEPLSRAIPNRANTAVSEHTGKLTRESHQIRGS